MAHKDKILTFEEILLTARVFVSLGIEKIRLTGGEPMLRRGIEDLIESLSELKSQGLKDLALTTNGFSFVEKAKELKQRGLDRVTLSLDSLHKENFEAITGVDQLENVLNSVEAAKEAGLGPVKINAVIVRGRNEHELPEFARFALESDVSMRFIEFMPLDAGHEWNREMVVSGREIFNTINDAFPLELKHNSRGASTSWNYGFAGTDKGEIGIIAPVTEMFCGACSRIRLTADGQIRTCLFSTVEHDLRDVLRSGADENEIVKYIQEVTLTKEARHHINDDGFVQPSRSMSFIGG